ncbi:MAG: UDP-3-O-(3-hydroxymyristoyl)glucosamine N-acyltransferase [Acidobacteria bacterium]|nr:UDP-3-O-(3-hydroxymyristoyl)glucosamine N-acyltransferase [Acidobacteriota bacterium]
MKLSELASTVGAVIENADADIDITSVASLEDALPGSVSFLSNPKYTPQVGVTKASAIFVGEGVEVARNDIAILRTKDPRIAYTLALRTFFPERVLRPGIHQTASIDASAVIDPNAEIGANVVIGANSSIAAGVRLMANVTVYDNVTIGENTIIHSGTAVRENTLIGRNCIIHNNSVIGADGFGYAKTEEKTWLKIPQTGRVVIEDDVEIGALSAVDRASVGETRIERGVKIDNMVQIGHSCTIDEDALICAQTGLAGSSHIGKRVILTGQVGIAGHLKVGDDAILTAKSATSHDVEPGKVVSGIPAFDNREWLRSVAAFRKLGEIAQRLRKLEKKVLSSDE